MRGNSKCDETLFFSSSSSSPSLLRAAADIPLLPDGGNSNSGTNAKVAIFSLYWKYGPQSFRICSLIAPLLLHSAAGQVIFFFPPPPPPRCSSQTSMEKLPGGREGGNALSLTITGAAKSLNKLEEICVVRDEVDPLRLLGTMGNALSSSHPIRFSFLPS